MFFAMLLNLITVSSLCLVSSIHCFYDQYYDKVEYNWENSYNLIGESTPVNGNLPNEVTIRCTLHDPEKRLIRVSTLVIEIFDDPGDEMHATIVSNRDRGVPVITKRCYDCKANGKIDGTSRPYFEILLYGGNASINYSCFAEVMENQQGYKFLRVDGKTRVSSGTPNMDDVSKAFQVTNEKLTKFRERRKHKLNVYGKQFTNNRNVLKSSEAYCVRVVNKFQRRINVTDVNMKSLLQGAGQIRVMFIAMQSQNDVFQTSRNSVLKYSHVLVNEGNAYNATTGRFRATVSGYYMFHFSVFISREAYIYLDLKMERKGDALKTILGGGQKGNRAWHYTEGQFVVKLTTGQAVYLSVRRAGGPVGAFRNALYPNRFDGFLLDPTVVTQ